MPRRESIPRIVDRIAVEMARLEAQVARLRHMDELLEKTSRETTGIKLSPKLRHLLIRCDTEPVGTRQLARREL